MNIIIDQEKREKQDRKNTKMNHLSENNLSICNQYRCKCRQSVSVDNYDNIRNDKILKKYMNCIQYRSSDSIATNKLNSIQMSVLRKSFKFLRKSIRKRKSHAHRFRYMKSVSLSEYGAQICYESNDNNSNDADDVFCSYHR